jgi:hypothetical protein
MTPVSSREYTPPSPKKFFLKSEDIRPIAKGHGACLASDLIMVKGRQVGFMYREEPDNNADSGWRFFAGTESDQYVNDPNNTGIYDVNTIANYDRSIVPFLYAPIGSAFERDEETGEFIPVELDTPAPHERGS